MGIEIERKFLVRGTAWRAMAPPTTIRQGYLCSDEVRSVRIRLAGDKAWLTIKSGAKGITRAEFEYAIPKKECVALLELCEGPLIEKERRAISFEGLIWEVDSFFGANAGLVIAEVELAREDQAFVKPEWIAEEVSADPRYLNSNLVKYPFSLW